MSTLGERIKYIRNNILKLNQAAFAERLGFSRFATISDYEKDKRSPDIDTLRSIASLGSVRLEWLLTGEGPVSIYEPKEPPQLAKESVQAVYSEEFVEIKVYEMSSVKNPREFPGSEPIAFLPVPKRDHQKGPVAIKVRGDAMSPSIMDGAVAGINPKDRNLVSGGLFAVWLEHEGAIVTRVFVYPESIVLKPDNPAFPVITLNSRYVKEEDLIIGKVVWVYQRY